MAEKFEPSTPPMSASTEGIVNRGREQNRQQRLLEKTRIDALKKSLPDKERFDIAKVRGLMDLADVTGEVQVTPEEVHALEVDYYLTNPDVKNLEEYTTHRKELDRFKDK